LCGVPLLRPQSAGRPKATLRIARWANQRGLVSETRVDKLRERYGSADYRAAHGVMRAVLVRSVAEDYSEALARVQAPVGFCWGERDTAATVDVAKRAAALVQNVCCFDVVDGVGHDVILQAPDRARRALDQVVEAACVS
jgi:pimeloyl-ACP methyl ester carboxylesterase